ncbi:acriflavin resistance protein [Oceaniferula spumae]|uniref:Acriflavin resistance protein n=1 Tax=Oceaniferula spumae TaxID=2979115 RepID=A0AAT9FI66_9BACT
MNKDTLKMSEEVKNASAAARFLFLRPIFGTLLAMLFSVGGVIAYMSLVKESLPDLDIPQATVVTSWPGADPQTIEQEVTEKLEKEIKATKGVKKITSASFNSFSMIAVEFDASAKSQESAALLRTAVDDASAELPRDAEKPQINQVSVDDRPILSFVVYGEVGDTILSRLAEDLEDRLERVKGVNEIVLGGARGEIVQILLDPNKLLSLGISPTKVRDSVQAANIDMPWGEIENDKMGQTLRLTGRFRDLESLRNLPVTRLGGSGSDRPVRLSEIASVRRDLKTEESRASYSWKGSEYASSIEVSVKKSPGADTIAVIESVRAELKEMQEGNIWPAGVSYQVTQDETETIWDSLTDAFNNGWQAMVAVFIILFLLLTWREGIIAGLSIPLTFLGALIIIWALGYTLNELVIIGMVLALGLMVDVFILMMEGLHEGIFVEKLSFGQAALKTVKRYAIPAAAGQATTILAMAPLMAIGGLPGKFIRVLPVTAIACLLTAFVIALLVDIPLARFLLGGAAKKQTESRKTRADRITEKLSEKMRLWSLKKPLRSRRTSYIWTAGAFGIFILSLFAVSQVSVIMYPKSDGRKLGISIELPPATTLEHSQAVADRLGKILQEKPYFESVVKLVGKKSPFSGGGLADALQPSTGDNYIGFSCVFLEREERDKDGYEIADDLRAELSKVINKNYAGAKIQVVPETGQPDASDPIEVQLTGDDLGKLREISTQVQTLVRGVTGTADVRDNLGPIRPEITLTPKREMLDFYGIQPGDLAAQVRFAMSTGEIGKFALSGVKEDLPIEMGIAWPSREGKSGSPTRVEELAMIRAYTPEGETVSLLSLLDPVNGEAPVSITHSDGRRAISVIGKAPDRPVNEIMAELTPLLDEMKADWPSGYSYSIGGEAQETAETFASAGYMLVVAIILVFGVLVLMFGSFTQAFILILTIPLALVGTFIGFYLTGTALSFFAMVGIIALIGIVANDAIVMVDTMNMHLRNGMGVHEAAAHGASDRLRPIISTSVTTIVGLIPMAITNPMWRPLCLAVIFGLIASTVLSLVIIPCLYALLTHEDHGLEESLD